MHCRSSLRGLATALAICVLAAPIALALPAHFSYQGHLAVDGVPHNDPDGSQTRLMFAVLCDDQIVWSNEDTSGNPPTTGVSLPVHQGVFSILLGDDPDVAPPMPPLDADLLDGCADPMLRLWVSTDAGQSFEQLSDERLSSSPFALASDAAERSIGDFAVESGSLILGDGAGPRVRLDQGGVVLVYDDEGGAQVELDGAGDGTITTGEVHVLNGLRFPDETVQTTAATGGGGPDADWTVVGDDMHAAVAGNVGIGTASPSARLDVVGTTQLSGGAGGGLLKILDGAGQPSMTLDGSENGGGSVVFQYNSAGDATVEIDADEGDVSAIRLRAPGSGNTTLELQGQDGGSPTDGGVLRLFDDAGQLTVKFDGKQATGGAILRMFDEIGQELLTIDGNEADAGSIINLRNESATRTIEIDSHESAGDGVVRVSDDLGTKTVEIDGNAGADGNINLYNNQGTRTIRLDSQEADLAGEIKLFDAAGVARIEIDADIGGTSRVITDVVEIRGGADLSEQFDVRDPRIVPGMVVTIDALNAGELRISDQPYDHRVAGVVSGAGGVRPGMLMGQRGSVADGEHPVALTGRVYCWADASSGPIEPGDLLTTSDVPGHAMKATEPDRAQGAVLGKAMTPLHQGRGLVLMLVALQ